MLINIPEPGGESMFWRAHVDQLNRRIFKGGHLEAFLEMLETAVDQKFPSKSTLNSFKVLHTSPIGISEDGSCRRTRAEPGSLKRANCYKKIPGITRYTS